MAQDPKKLLDGLSTVEGGVDTGKVPSLLFPNQLSTAVNCSLRGGFLRPRPGVNRVELVFDGNSILETRQKTGRFQVAGYYKPDSGPECIIASIGGRQFRFNVLTDNSVQEITITYETETSANFVPPAIGVNVTITVLDTSFMSVGATILVNGFNYTVEVINSGTSVTIKNVDDDGSVNPVPSGSPVISYDPNPSTIEQAWEVQAEKWWILRDGESIPFIYNGSSSRRANSNLPGVQKEIGPGRMMTYAMGRIWGALTDERSFRAGDLVFGTSGTPIENFRDSVLKESENGFLANGRDFTTPTSAGGIKAMRGMATLDTSLGQGPIQLLTPYITFSVNSPLDRTQWSALENPIQTVSLITNGGLSHYASILVNGDLLFRSRDGIRSLILARREFASWGNTPISREMNRFLDLDDQRLLKFSSASVFNNRLLMTTSPFRTNHGIYHRGWISLDFDLISSMGNKASPVYDGIGVGLNVLQFVVGEFAGKERCFAFTLNFEQEIELYEFTTAEKFDRQSQHGSDIPIAWAFETPAFRFASSQFPERKVLKQLNNLELEIAQLVGEVNFKVYWRPDNYPCWLLWKEFTECAEYKDCSFDPLTGCQKFENAKPQFRPMLSLGQPPDTCDPITDRPFRQGYSFQVRFEINGYCEIKNIFVSAEERAETNYPGELVCG